MFPPSGSNHYSNLESFGHNWQVMSMMDHGNLPQSLDTLVSHTRDIFRPSLFSFFNCSLFRGLSKEADGPSHLYCCFGLFGWITSIYHELSTGRRGPAALCQNAEQVMETLQNVGSGGVTSGLASHLDASQFSL